MTQNRPTFFQTIAAGAAGLGLSSAGSWTFGAAAKDPNAPLLRIGDDLAVMNTTYGRVRGYILRDIYYFL